MSNEQPTIVVGVAGREDSAAAVRYAAAEHERQHLPVVLVHALHPLLTSPDSDAIPVTQEPVLRAGEQMLTDAASDLRRQVGVDAQVDARLVVGRAAPTLAKYPGAAVVVLQPDHMGTGHHIPTYSVTTATAAHSSAPVVAVPSSWTEPDTGQVTVGVDALGEPAHLLTTAFREARSRGVGLRVVHAWHYSVYDDVVFPGAEARRHSDQLTDQIRAHLDPVAATFADVPVELVVRQARPADALVAESEGSALLVVGRHRTSLPVAHLGSIGRAVLRESRCPVMIVDPVGEAQPA